MIGQEKLLQFINFFKLGTLPHSILLCGERGSGRHLIASYMGEHFGLHLEDLTNHLDQGCLEQLSTTTLPTLALIDTFGITEKEQGMLLKLTEEPPSNLFLMLLSETKNLLLNALLNRLSVWNMDRYSQAELNTFTNNPIALSLIRTPGKILLSNQTNLQKMEELCSTILCKVGVASLANTLTLVDRINYKDEYDKYDFNIFLDDLLSLAYKNYANTSSSKFLSYYHLTALCIEKAVDGRLNRRMLMENYLIGLWEAARA